MPINDERPDKEIQMHIEHSLALIEIAKMLDRGYGKQAAITQAAKFVKTQGFSAKYAKQVAEQMAELL